MTHAQLDSLLKQIAQEVAALPVPAVQLVGALVSMQNGLPPAIHTFVMAQLSQRADLSEVSPAAEAMMRMQAFSTYSDMAFAQLEIQAQHALLKAVALDDKVLVAAAFMSRLAEYMAQALTPADQTLKSSDAPAAVAAPHQPPAPAQTRPSTVGKPPPDGRHG